MELDCPVQSYAWGKLGLSSAVASFKASSDEAFQVNTESPYAELWMGTHPNGPAKIKGSGGGSLKEHLQADPTLLGERSRRQFGDDLPFLFKVLSVNKALSIQTHPDKENARRLHAERPDIYKDPNHKPEMAIALTDFEGLCGFRPLSEIQGFLQSTRQLSDVVGASATANLVAATKSDYSGALKKAFTALMEAPKDVIKRSLDSLEKEVSAKADKNSTDGLFLRLLGQYPGDVGCLVIFFLNHIRLRPGEAMFLGPNLIHAYLSGDCMECMACSDNVVRAGLTPKLIDVPTLCSLLRYECAPGEDMKFAPTEGEDGVSVYDPPVPDFAVARIIIKQGSKKVPPVRDSASLFIVTSGQGSAADGVMTSSLKKGTVLFLGAEKKLEIANGGEELVVFQAYC